MREACLGPGSCVTSTHCFQLCFLFKERARRKAEADVDADVAADRPTRSTIAAPTTERRRRGSSGRAAQREAV
jgi:hypothetical protein